VSTATSTQPQITHIETWARENAASFAPPVMNKLLHRDQLSIMFVGGPNSREDFHLEEGSEFFYQLKGDMELPTIQAGRRVNVVIREGDVFLLPSRIPHSPQRPHAGSLGLVVERKRYEDEPPDGLRYYTDFNVCDTVLWERYFICYDLGRDLAPVVAAFNASTEKATRVPTAESVPADPPLKQDTVTVVPPPFSLSGWLEQNAAALDRGEALNLFEGHPDREFDVRVVGGPSHHTPKAWHHETFLYQLEGDALVSLLNGPTAENPPSRPWKLEQGSCVVVPAGCSYRVERPAGSRGMEVRNDPRGNKTMTDGI
jgi:3-hydroxyanthranilate 3,4-dioxygenase